MIRRIALVFLLGVAVLMVSSVVAMLVVGPGAMQSDTPWLVPFLTHGTMLALSMLLMAVFSRGDLTRFGMRKPTGDLPPLFLAWGLGLGVVSTIVLDCGFHENIPGTEKFTLCQIVIFIWIFASLCEETLVRGLLQSMLSPLKDHGIWIARIRLSVPVLVAGFFFAAMHLPLLTLGISGRVMAVILLFTLLLGTVAGYCREKNE